jgi:hypothetical protein
MTTTAQQTALEQPVVRIAYFVEFAFKTATQRLSTLNIPVTWGGYGWAGLGTLGNISAIEESDSIEPKGLTFTLNAADPSWLALSIGNVGEYRGRLVKLYMCPLDEGFQLIDTPEICWRGYMDMMSTGVEKDGSGGITLKCETAAYGLKRRPALRLNAAQQKQRQPGDTGFNYLQDLIANPQTWLSKKFQQV